MLFLFFFMFFSIVLLPFEHDFHELYPTCCHHAAYKYARSWTAVDGFFETSPHSAKLKWPQTVYRALAPELQLQIGSASESDSQTNPMHRTYDLHGKGQQMFSTEQNFIISPTSGRSESAPPDLEPRPLLHWDSCTLKLTASIFSLSSIASSCMIYSGNKIL